MPIADGACEIFPNERAESQRIGKAIRAPGTLNPKTGAFSLIEAETVTPLLEALPRTWSLGVGKVTCSLLRNGTALSLHKSTNNYFLTTYSPSTKPLVEALLARYLIKRKRTRNNVLMQLIGDLIHKFGREASERIAEEHYRRYESNIGSSLDDHRRDFAVGWEGMRKKLMDSFSRAEMDRFDKLTTQHQREGFFIVRAFAGVAVQKKENDFAISQASLADRLSVTPPGAATVIQKLCELRIIEQTQSPVKQKAPARYRWLL